MARGGGISGVSIRLPVLTAYKKKSEGQRKRLRLMMLKLKKCMLLPVFALLPVFVMLPVFVFD